MRKEFLLNLLFLFFINLLIKPFYIFGIDRTVQNTVADGDYGIYLALMNFTFLFQIINDFGIQQFNNRNIAQYNQLIEKYVPNILILKVGLSLLYTLVVGMAAWGVGYLPKYMTIFWFFVYNQILVSLLFFLRSNIAGLGYYYIDSIVSSLDRLILIVVCGLLLWGNLGWGVFQIEWFVYAQSFSLTLTSLIAGSIVFRRLRYVRFRFHRAFLLLILQKSYPYAILVFLMTAYTRIDMVMLERLLLDGKFENDIYGAAYRLLDAANMIGFLFAGLLLPMFSKLSKNSMQQLRHLYCFSFELILCITLPVVLSVFLFRYDIMFLLYDKATPYWGDILGYLILNLIPISGIYIAGTLLLADGYHVELNKRYAVGFVVNAGLNLLLLFGYKAAGASIATLLTQSMVWVFLMVLLKQKKGFVSFRGQFCLLLGVQFLVFALFYWTSFGAAWQWCYRFLAVGIVLGTISVGYLLLTFDVRKLVFSRN